MERVQEGSNRRPEGTYEKVSQMNEKITARAFKGREEVRRTKNERKEEKR